MTWDAVLRIPTVDNLCHTPTVAEAVNDVLAPYEAWVKADSLQGTTVKKSGRYNAVDTVNTPAHLRWPNEGFQGNATVGCWVAHQHSQHF